MMGIAQERPISEDRNSIRGSQSHVNFRLDEYFDEEREDGVTDAGHPDTLELRHPNGGFSFNTRCHWRKRERNRPASLFTSPAPGEDQEDEEKRPIPEPIPMSIAPFRSISTGGFFQIPTGVEVPRLSTTFPSDLSAVDFDSIQLEGMPGGMLSTRLAFGEFEFDVFGRYLSGSFESDPLEVTRLVASTPPERPPEGREEEEEPPPADPPRTVTDRFDLSGRLWLIEMGAAPILKRFATPDGLLTAEVGILGGVYVGRLTEMTVTRSGSIEETESVEDRTLFGFLAGPMVRGSIRLAPSFRIGIAGQFVRLFGDVQGWTGGAGLELQLQW